MQHSALKAHGLQKCVQEEQRQQCGQQEDKRLKRAALEQRSTDMNHNAKRQRQPHRLLQSSSDSEDGVAIKDASNRKHESTACSIAVSKRQRCQASQQDRQDVAAMGRSKYFQPLSGNIDASPKSSCNTKKMPISTNNPISNVDNVEQPADPKWLKFPVDMQGRSSGDANYNPTTLHIPSHALQAMSQTQRQFWTIKSAHFDTVIFMKIGDSAMPVTSLRMMV